MDDELRALFRKGASHGTEIEQVKLRTFQTSDLAARRESRRSLDQIIADESAGTSDPGE